jgi:hypothetical protein
VGTCTQGRRLGQVRLKRLLLGLSGGRIPVQICRGAHDRTCASSANLFHDISHPLTHSRTLSARSSFSRCLSKVTHKPFSSHFHTLKQQEPSHENGVRPPHGWVCPRCRRRGRADVRKRYGRGVLHTRLARLMSPPRELSAIPKSHQSPQQRAFFT